METLPSLENIASKLRYRVVEHSHRTGTPHLGSCLSCIDILTALYFLEMNVDPSYPNDPSRDRFFLSKGHAAPALFQTLAMRGYFDYSDLLQSKHNGTDFFGEHPPTPEHLPGIEAATGSLGHGLPMATGVALFGKIKNLDFHTFVVVGDGECNEGSIWEALAFASSQKLNRLIIFVDYNKWQATDRSEDVMNGSDFFSRFKSFGCATQEIDGNSISAIVSAIEAAKKVTDRPSLILSHTIKGKGISFMENDNNWHYRTPNKIELEKAAFELGIS